MNAARPRNPFKPTFGTSSPLLVGRDEMIRDFSDALEDGPGAPARATIYTGARGTGKTVMLNTVQDEARSRGWLVVAETATPGLLGRLTTEHLPQLLAEQDPKATRRRLSGITAPAGLGGASWETTDLHKVAPGLRFLLAMAKDDGPSRISDIAKRMAVKPDYANAYRVRLMENQLVESVGRGQLNFALPGLREYLREHAAIDHIAK